MNTELLKKALKKDYTILEKYPVFINASLYHKEWGAKKLILYPSKLHRGFSNVFGVVYHIRGGIRVIRSLDTIYGYSGGFIDSIQPIDLNYRDTVTSTKIYFSSIKEFLNMDFSIGDTEKVLVYYANPMNELNDVRSKRFRKVSMHKDFFNIFVDGFKKDIDIQNK
jgi:hypothetical protein